MADARPAKTTKGGLPPKEVRISEENVASAESRTVEEPVQPRRQNRRGSSLNDDANAYGGPLLAVEGLRVCFEGEVEALRGVSFSLDRGETLAVVGESGAGKSTLALCLAGLIQPPVADGSVRVDGQELMGAEPETLRQLRWARVALAPQGAPFNPVVTVGAQVAEPLREHRGMSRGEARRRVHELAAEVALDPAVLERYPHQVSGGERRRALLAMVLTLDPDLVILDEPTAGLDLDTANRLVERLGSLAADRRFGLVVISHNLPDASRLARRCVVLYAGEAMEVGDTREVVGRPVHPYTWALVNAYPVMTTTKDLRAIRGRPPDPRDVPTGCPFNPRCTQAEDICVAEHPDLRQSRGREVACHFGGLKTLLSANEVHKVYRQRGQDPVTALRGVSVAVAEGESVGIVGPSGSGKSTLARILTGHLDADAGDVEFEGQALVRSWRKDLRSVRRRVQLIMQDPADALSPRLTVEQLVREPLDVAREGDDAQRRGDVAVTLESVGLPSEGDFLRARTHQLSGGQLQRIALARALIAHPKVLVADEPTAMLDASEQARLLQVLRERQVAMGLGLVLVSHDMAVVRKVTDRIVVLDAGTVAEDGPSNLVSAFPRSAVASRLVKAAPAFAPLADPSEPGAPTTSA